MIVPLASTRQQAILKDAKSELCPMSPSPWGVVGTSGGVAERTKKEDSCKYIAVIKRSRGGGIDPLPAGVILLVFSSTSSLVSQFEPSAMPRTQQHIERGEREWETIKMDKDFLFGRQISTVWSWVCWLLFKAILYMGAQNNP